MLDRRFISVFAFAALLVAGLPGAARAEDRITLRANHVPGDVIAFRSATRLRMASLHDHEQRHVGPADVAITQTARSGRVVVLEAANGLVSKASVTYDKSTGGFTDTSDGRRKNFPFPVAGQTLAVTVDPDGTVRSDRTLSKDVVSDLELTVPVYTAFFPAQPVKVGDSWDISGETLARSMSMPEGSTCSGQAQLVGVEAVDGRPAARVAVRLTFSGQTRTEASTFVADVVMEGTILFDLKTGRALRSSLIGRITTSTEYAQVPGALSNGEGELRMDFTGTLSHEDAKPARLPPNPLEQPGAAPDFSGTYVTEGLTVTLEKAEGGYRGTIVAGDKQYPLTATAAGNQLTGQFTADGNAFPFSATLDGDALTLKSGTTTYALKKRPAVVNPLEALR